MSLSLREGGRRENPLIVQKSIRRMPLLSSSHFPSLSFLSSAAWMGDFFLPPLSFFFHTLGEWEGANGLAHQTHKKEGRKVCGGVAHRKGRREAKRRLQFLTKEGEEGLSLLLLSLNPMQLLQLFPGERKKRWLLSPKKDPSDDDDEDFSTCSLRFT